MNKRRRIIIRKGFTLAELLIVVAIIGILSGFGFVAAMRYQRALKVTENADIAREIFLAAQNRLTASWGRGTWEKYLDSYRDDTTGKLKDSFMSTGNRLKTGPNGVITVSNLSSVEPLASEMIDLYLLPKGSIDETVRSNSFVIRLDPEAHSIYEVYYTDNRVTFDNSALKDEPGASGWYVLGDKNVAVGHYGGVVSGANPEKDILDTPEVEVINGENLYLKIKDSYKSISNDQLRINVALLGMTSGADTLDSPITISRTSIDDRVIYDASNEYFYCLLDSVTFQTDEYSGHFANNFPNLIPGENLKALVTASNADGASVSKTAQTKVFNSLFAESASIDSDTGEAKLYIANGRHLQNLSSDVSGLHNLKDADNKTVFLPVSAKIIKDITWNTTGIRTGDSFWEKAKKNPQVGTQDWNSGDTVYLLDKTSGNKHLFQSIDWKNSDNNPSITGFSTPSGSKEFLLDGQGHILAGLYFENLNPVDTGAGVGLFGTLSSGYTLTIQDLLIEDPRSVSADSITNPVGGSISADTGTLIGHSEGKVHIVRCGSYLTYSSSAPQPFIDSYTDLSGKVRDIETKHSYNSLTPTRSTKTVFAGKGNAGGLIGSVTGSGETTISNGFAAVPVIAGGNTVAIDAAAGGLIGYVGKDQTVSVENSFTGGYIKSSTNQDYTADTVNIAVLEGTGGSSKYAAGGLIGRMDADAADITESYSTASVGTVSGSNSNTKNIYLGGAVGLLAPNSSSVTALKIDSFFKSCYCTGRVFYNANLKNVASGRFCSILYSTLGTTVTLDSDSVENWVLVTSNDPVNTTGTVFAYPSVNIYNDNAVKSVIEEYDSENTPAGSSSPSAYTLAYGLGSSSYRYLPYYGCITPSYLYEKEPLEEDETEAKEGWVKTGKKLFDADDLAKTSKGHVGDWPEGKPVYLDTDIENGNRLVAKVTVPAGTDTISLFVIGDSSSFLESTNANAVYERIVIRRSSSSAIQYGTDGGLSSDNPEAGGLEILKIKTDAKGSKTVEYSLSSDSIFTIDDDGKMIYNIVLDDITTASGHFANICTNLIPGENIGLLARAGDVKEDQSILIGTAPGTSVLFLKELANKIHRNEVGSSISGNTKLAISQRVVKITNSLFDFGTSSAAQTAITYDTDSRKIASLGAKISTIRHLENLGLSISGIDSDDIPAITAKQMKDLSWEDFLNDLKTVRKTVDPNYDAEISVYEYETSGTVQAKSKDNCFMPINSVAGLTYSGLDSSTNKIYSISGIQVDGQRVKKNSGTGEFTDSEYIDNVGLFGQLSSGEVSDLFLIDSIVSSAGDNVGALAGKTLGTAIENIVAYHSAPTDEKPSVTWSIKSNGDGSAGGLIGTMRQGSVLGSSASLIVFSESGSAGGLIGTVNDTNNNEVKTVSIDGCYSGGHTVNGGIYDAVDYNVTTRGTNASAGGLIGLVNGANINNCYSTCSVNGIVDGGLIGSFQKGTVKNTYATGRIQKVSAQGNVSGAFIGSVDQSVSANSFNGNYYLEIVNEVQENGSFAGYLNPIGTTTITVTDQQVKPIDSDILTYQSMTGTGGTPQPYDSLLGSYFQIDGNAYYPYLTIEDMVTRYDPDNKKKFTKVHYGDWPAPETLVINTAS